MKRVCSHCFQEIKEGEKNCSLCKNPYIPVSEEENYKPVKERTIRTKLHIPKGVLAIVASAVIAVAAATAGTLLYLRTPETPESAALNGINMLLHADIREFAARHAFMEADISLAIRTGRAAMWDDAVLPLVWNKYSNLNSVLNELGKNDIKINAVNSEELSEAEKDAELKKIFNSIITDSDNSQARVDMIESIIDSITDVYRVDLEATIVNEKDAPDALIIVLVGLIDGKYSILSETMQ
ncbi:MAG: hypothetical protein FWD38_05550 [Oscillospiraceae bacterium]|nr:hypothetical protein [Oscillospiraceae bacterium]